MSRIRMIKPDFWKSEQVYNCSRNARLFFIGLWNFAQDTGVIKLNLSNFKLEIFPMDSDITQQDILKYIKELLNNKLIIGFKRDNQDWIYIPTWKKHQRMDFKARSEPIPEENELCLFEIKSYDSTFHANRIEEKRIEENRIVNTEEVSVYNIPSKTSSSKAISLPKTNPLFNQHVLDIYNFWKETMGKRAQLDDKRKKRIVDALKNYSVEDIFSAIKGCSKIGFYMGKNKDGVKYNDIELILRDAKRIEFFIEHAENESEQDKNEKFWENVI